MISLVLLYITFYEINIFFLIAFRSNFTLFGREWKSCKPL